MRFLVIVLMIFKCGQAEEKLEAGGDEKLIFNFIWPYAKTLILLLSPRTQYVGKGSIHLVQFR